MDPFEAAGLTGLTGLTGRSGSAAGQPAGPRDPREPAAARRLPGPLAVLAATLFLGAGVLLPRIGPNGALVDPLLIAAIVAGAVALRSAPVTPATAGVRAVLPALAVVAIGTGLSFFGAGVHGWNTLNVAQSVYALLTFATVYGLLWRERAWVPVFGLGLAAGIVVVTVSLAVTYRTGIRPSGTLYHPNYAGHYLVTAAFGAWAALPWRRVRWAVVCTALVGVFLTASFGALLMIGAATAYLMLSALRTRPGVVAYGLAVLVLLGGLGAAFVRTDTSATTTVGASSTLSSSRFERSGSGRLYIWGQALGAAKDHPLGVGPDGLHNRGFITRFREAHNLYVAFLAERGVIGLAGLLLLGLALWRHAPPGGTARAALLAFAVANMFRETLHYRHMWLVLALLLVVDHGDRLDALTARRSYLAARVRERVLPGRR